MNGSSKIALVTGATRGIGLETVRQLAASGLTVLLAGRDLARATAAAEAFQAQGLPVVPIALDVTDPDGIQQVALQIEQRFGQLDVLINNAGVLLDEFSKPPSQQSLETWRATFDTNLFAVVQLTQALLPLLKRAPAARVVNLSSQLGSFGWHTDPSSPIYDFKAPVAYNASKSALNAWTVHLAYELRETKIKVNAVHPGYVQTDMNGGEGEIDVATGAKSSVQMATLEDDGPSGTFTHLGQTLPW